MKQGRVFWLFGFSGAGKTTLATGLLAQLRAAGRPCLSLDGDELRAGLCRDLGFSDESRLENIRRVAEVAKLAVDQGVIVVAALITPSETMRRQAVEIVGADRLDLVWVDVPLTICQQRDPKGLYRRAAAGNLPQFTGIGSPFEAAQSCALQLRSGAPETMLGTLVEFCRQRLA